MKEKRHSFYVELLKADVTRDLASKIRKKKRADS